MEIGKFFLREFSIDNEFEKRGGEAIVSKARHPRLGEVAIKRWTNTACKIDTEIKLLIQNSDHQNIIQFLGILMNNESNYIGYITPFMPLGSLHDVIHNKAKKYDQKQISSWITQICYGLSHLHYKNIIHRDIKPSNVLLGKSHDDVKLSDLGMARSLKIVDHSLTKLGTPLYMAPEIFKGGEYDFSADIYSLSITIWEILHRRIPYDHIALQFDLLTKISNGERPQMNKDLSKEVSDLLTKCWHADVSKRPIIGYILNFSINTYFLPTSLESSVNNLITDFINVHALNDSEDHLETIFEVKRESPLLEPIEKNPDLTDSDTLLDLVFGIKREPPVPEPIEKTSELSDSDKLLEMVFGVNKKLPILEPIKRSLEKETIILLGGVDGKNNDSALMLENNGQNWKKLNIKLSYPIEDHGAQFLNNNLYIFGGWNSINEELNWTYKLSKGLQWEKMADMNQILWAISNSSVILNNQIWVCGGRDRGKLKHVEMYNPLTNKWKEMKEMNESRSFAAAAVVNDKIFCSGGFMNNSVECYDPSSDVWTLISNMPKKIWGHGAVGMNGHFIVIGGYNFQDEYLNNVWALDTMDKNAIWIEKPSMPVPCNGFSIAKIDGEIFVCGGEVWRDGPKMLTSRSYAPAVVIPMQFVEDLKL